MTQLILAMLDHRNELKSTGRKEIRLNQHEITCKGREDNMPVLWPMMSLLKWAVDEKQQDVLFLPNTRNWLAVTKRSVTAPGEAARGCQDVCAWQGWAHIFIQSPWTPLYLMTSSWVQEVTPPQRLVCLESETCWQSSCFLLSPSQSVGFNLENPQQARIGIPEGHSSSARSCPSSLQERVWFGGHQSLRFIWWPPERRSSRGIKTVAFPSPEGLSGSSWIHTGMGESTEFSHLHELQFQLFCWSFLESPKPSFSDFKKLHTGPHGCREKEAPFSPPPFF